MKNNINKSLLILFLLTLISSVSTYAQRTVRGTYGIEGSIGTPIIRGGKLIDTRNFVAELGVHRYRSLSHYYSLSLLYQERTARFKVSKEAEERRVPLQHLTMNAGHSWRIFSDRGSIFFLYGNVGGIAGFEFLNKTANKIPDERSLIKDTRFIGGVYGGFTAEAFVSDHVAFNLKSTMRVMWGSQMKYFHPTIQAGIKVNF